MGAETEPTVRALKDHRLPNAFAIVDCFNRAVLIAYTTAALEIIGHRFGFADLLPVIDITALFAALANLIKLQSI